MRTVFVFLEPEQFDGLKNVSGEGAVRIKCDPEHGRVFLFMRSGTSEGVLSGDLSLNISRMASREWVYVGQVVGAA